MESSTATFHQPCEAAPEAVAEEPRAPVPMRRQLGRVALLLVLACLGAGLGYLRAWPPVATVMSASMAPTIETGDVVLLRRLQGPPRTGDIIAISVPEAARARYGYPPQVIHRIVKIAPNGEITTKGDARKKVDPFTVRRSSVESEVVGSIPAAGRVLTFLTSTLGLIWLAAGVLMLVILPLLERQRETGGRGVEGIDEMRAELRADLQAVREELVRLQARLGEAPQQVEATVELPAAAAVLEPMPVPEPVPVPAPEPVPVPVPEPVLQTIEHWTNVFFADPLPTAPARDAELDLWTPSIEPWTRTFSS